MQFGIFKQRSVQVLFAITVYLVFAEILPLSVHQWLYTISLLIKDLLLWILPLTVGFFIAYAILSFEKQAFFFILTLFVFEAISNSTSVWYSFGCGHLAANYLPHLEPCQIDDSFSPLWRISQWKPAWWAADKGTIAGIAIGLIAVFRIPLLRKVIAQGKKTAEWVLTKIFSRLIPIFILGFVARMYQTRLLSQMFSQYTNFLLWLIFFVVLYISMLFLIGSHFSLKKFFLSVKNLFPAAGMAFSSGCSLSTMPWTIEGSAKNLRNPELANAVIPATTNIQQIGDCIANTFLCFLLYLHFNGVAPSLSLWIPFSLAFVLVRYATAAVLGGAVFMMLPIYEYYLNFTPEMIALILAFNVILDPLITCSNVVANGALCRIFEMVWTAMQRKRKVLGDTLK